LHEWAFAAFSWREQHGITHARRRPCKEARLSPSSPTA
jgi:hypothetical protein